MPDSLTTNSPIIAAYRAATPGSAARAAEAAEPVSVGHHPQFALHRALWALHRPRPRAAEMGCRRQMLRRLFRRARRDAARALQPRR